MSLIDKISVQINKIADASKHLTELLVQLSDKSNLKLILEDKVESQKLATISTDLNTLKRT